MYYLKEYILRVIRKISPEETAAGVIGPASPGIDKIKDVYRRVIYIKAEKYETLTGIKDRVEQYIEINSGFDNMRIQFDFNPM